VFRVSGKAVGMPPLGDRTTVNMMTEIMYRLKQIYNLDDELDDLASLLAFQPTSSDAVFDFFAKLPDAQIYGSSPYRFLYRPGTRGNIQGTQHTCGRARSCSQMGANPIPEGRPATG